MVVSPVDLAQSLDRDILRGAFNMTDQTILQTYNSWIAIDIAKDSNVVAVETIAGKKSTFRVVNSHIGHDRLMAVIHDLPQPCRICFEPTGDYHRTLGFRLISEGFDVCLVSSVAAARYRDAMFNSWDKNDPKDAHVLLQLLKQGLVQKYVDPLVAGNLDLQEISKTYYHLTLARTRLHHSIHTHYLPLYFPEMGKWLCSTRADWWLAYMMRFPCPSAITKLSLAEFCIEASPIIGRKVNKEAKLVELYETAKTSIGLPISADSNACITFKMQLQRYQEFNAQRMQLETMASKVMATMPEYAILKSVPGIGPVIALTILAEAGDLRRFDHHRQFLKYCGLDLAKSQSGNMRGKERLSKRGNARLRLALWIATTIAIRMRENTFRDKYARYIKSDPMDADRRRKALTAVTAKMARVIYGLVKSNELYKSKFEALPSGSTSL